VKRDTAKATIDARNKVMMTAGMVMIAVSMWQMTQFSLMMDEDGIVISGLIQGFGFGGTSVPLNIIAIIALSNLPRHILTQGTAVRGLMRNLGGSIGIAFVTTMLARGAQTHHFPSKDELVVAVVEHVFRRAAELGGERLQRIAAGAGDGDFRALGMQRPRNGAADAAAKPNDKAVDTELSPDDTADNGDVPSIIAPEKSTRSSNGLYEFREERWVELYSKKIEEMIAVMKSKGVPVLWVGLPAVRGTKATADMLFLDSLYRDAAGKAGITYVDVWDGFVDEAGRATEVTVVAGQLDVQPARHGAERAMHLEEAADLVDDVVEAAGLVTTRRLESVAVHGIADPGDLGAAGGDLLHQRR